MKAILCTHFGGPADLEYGELPDPAPAAGEVVVAVKAAALNFFDTLLIAGKYQFKPPFPFSPAAEFAGVIERVGDGVTTFKAGDRVLGYGGHRAGRGEGGDLAPRGGENPNKPRLRPGGRPPCLFGPPPAPPKEPPA